MANENQGAGETAGNAPANNAPVTAVSTKQVVSSAAADTPKADKPVTQAKPASPKAIAAKAYKPARRVKARKTNKPRQAKPARNERTNNMNKNNIFNADALPGLAPFQTMLNDAGNRGQEMVERGQKVAAELAELARANVEAMIEAGQVMTDGARNIGQKAVSSGRDGFEQAADAIRSLAEAKSPTEYMQRQGEIARASFDRMVSESSKMTESLVKLAGEAFQPISNRASANAERFNTLVA